MFSILMTSLTNKTLDTEIRNLTQITVRTERVNCFAKQHSGSEGVNSQLLGVKSNPLGHQVTFLIPQPPW